MELLATHHPDGDEMDAYERLLGDAMRGDPTLFAREDYVEQAWRIVDPILEKSTPGLRIRTGHLGPGRSRPPHRTARRLAQSGRDEPALRSNALKPLRHS